VAGFGLSECTVEVDGISKQLGAAVSRVLVASFGSSECAVEVDGISKQLGAAVSRVLVASFGSSECAVEVDGISKQLGAVSRASKMGELARICGSMLSSRIGLNCTDACVAACGLLGGGLVVRDVVDRILLTCRYRGEHVHLEGLHIDP
jgi:hypothetical protein